MSCFLVLVLPLYLGLVWVLTRLLCRDAAHRKSHVVAAAVALALAVLVGSLGVPYADNPNDQVGLLIALGLLAVGPILFGRLGRRARIVLGLAVLAAFTEPVVRVEYLTWRHGETLRRAFLADNPEAGDERLFSVLAHSRKHAEVLRVETNKTAYLMRFERPVDGSWRVNPASYPPQLLLWYDGNSDTYHCPYPTSVLLILHGVGAWCG